MTDASTSSPVPLSMSEADFSTLYVAAGSHATFASDLEQHGSYGTPASPDMWRFYYVFDDNRASLALACMYLTAIGAAWQQGWDGEDEQWYVFTDYGVTTVLDLWTANEHVGVVTDLGLWHSQSMNTADAYVLITDNRLTGIITATRFDAAADYRSLVLTLAPGSGMSAHTVNIPDGWAIPTGVSCWDSLADYLVHPEEPNTVT